MVVVDKPSEANALDQNKEAALQMDAATAPVQFAQRVVMADEFEELLTEANAEEASSSIVAVARDVTKAIDVGDAAADEDEEETEIVAVVSPKGCMI
ncbi:hypothetical protein LTR28_004094 [Elasticomyces elasticus]|nr:hypothetical protein LTR28_004094 [Elasticomyces elasticus]